MERNVLLFSILLFVFSCKKENEKVNQHSGINSVSIMEEQPGKFKKELIIEDDSKKNRIYLAIYSDDSVSLNQFIEETNLTLIKSTSSSLKSTYQENEYVDSIENENKISEINTKIDKYIDSL